MRNKLFIPIIFLLAATLLSACSGNVQFGQNQPRTISVTGYAQVLLSPDIAYISIGVHPKQWQAITHSPRKLSMRLRTRVWIPKISKPRTSAYTSRKSMIKMVTRWALSS